MRIQIVLILCVCIIVTSCENKQNSERVKELKSLVQDNLGKRLILPDTIIMYYSFPNYTSDSTEIFNSKYKIYSYINASCGTCILNIELWNSLIPELNKYKVPVILICNSDDEFELFHYLCESRAVKEFPYPFVFDRNREYIRRNRFMGEVEDFKTVLTDANDTILLMGNPVINEKIKKLYLDRIAESP